MIMNKSIMSLSSVFTKFHQSLSFCCSAFSVKRPTNLTQFVFFSHICNSFRLVEHNKLTQASFSPMSLIFRGYKIKGHLQLRCKDCYIVRKDGIVQVLCTSYPRHKQIKLTKRTKYSWILTYAFHSKKRPY